MEQSNSEERYENHEYIMPFDYELKEENTTSNNINEPLLVQPPQSQDDQYRPNEMEIVRCGGEGDVSYTHLS